MKKNEKQGVIKTDFYDSFQCVGGECPITCCQEWKIEVDEETFGCWNKKYLNDSDNLPISSYVNEVDGYGLMKLNQDKKCPFLNQDKLCDLVIKFGDEILSDTCATFPREIHQFENRTEYSLVSCCPIVIDLLNREDVVKLEGTDKKYLGDELYRIRDILIGIMKDKCYDISTALKMCFFVLLDIYHEGDSEEVIAQFEKEDVMDELSKHIEEVEFNSATSFGIRNDFFLDLAVNYRKEGLYTRYIEPIYQLAEQYENCEELDEVMEQFCVFEKQLEEYENLFRNYLITELFHNMLIPESDLESMVIMLQWIGLSYSMIKHCTFLEWMLEGHDAIKYDSLKAYMVILSRMTGYDIEDIYEYFENSFEDYIWEWSYFGLIVGEDEQLVR